MSTSDLQKFPGGTQDKGVNNFEPDIGAEITWDQTTVNVTGGVRRGVGVRYGIAPLAGHSNTETPSGTATNGIMRSETSSGSQGLVDRWKIFGIVPLTLAPYDGAYPKSNKQFYLYLVGLNIQGATRNPIDACLGAILSSSVNKQENTFVAGLAQNSYSTEGSSVVRRHKTELLNLPQTTTPTSSDVCDILLNILTRYWIPYAHISVSGKRVPYNYMLGDVTSAPASGTTPGLNIWTTSSTTGTSPTVYCGAPSEIITRSFTDNFTRTVIINCLDATLSKIAIAYTATFLNSDTTAVSEYGTGTMYAAVAGSKTGASTGYSSVEAAVIIDAGSYTNSRHDAVLCAGNIPIAIVYQDWLKAVKGMMPRWVDLSNPGCTPRAGIGVYSDDGTGVKPSAFINYSQCVPVPDTDPTGVLEPGQSYDIGFSYYNKLLDFETNVFFGTAVEVAGDPTTDPPVGVCVCSLASNHFSVWQLMQGISGQMTVPWDFSPTKPVSTEKPARGLSINDYEIRFYYRASGAGEWLPAGNYDAADYWFSYGWVQIGSVRGPMICRAPQGGLPGGQPNGFIDYSPLPKQTYVCTVVFQNRAFWWSEKSMHFSLLNNIYAYPTRNIVASPTGKWRGGIVHSQKDLSQQLSRLVVFGDQTFSCRFTGEKTFQNVRISSESVGQFEVDGSDFRMEYLCDSTAFSFRSACIGEGVLYWWGPQGVYRDDGMSPPKKISGILEPDIWDFVDMARDTEVHCVYNKRTMEVIWFYPPKVTDATYPTYGLIYNVENDKFYNFKVRMQVDSSQNIKIENDTTPDDVDGERILIHCREGTSETNQRTYYFDDLVEAGEQGYGRELTILTVATPSTGSRRLTFAAGSVGVTAGSIEVNDLICIQNAKGYAPSLTLADDMIAKITAVNNASGYIDILLPDGASFDATASLTGQTAFPIYQKKPTAAGLHGITYLMQTNYWLPDGLSNSWYWLYLYLLFNYSGIPTPTNPLTDRPTGAQIALGYRSLVCSGALSDTLSLTDNSSGHCQIHHPLRNQGRSGSGQALSYSLSGIHIGNPWTLEYLEAHCKKEAGFTLKEFEG